MKLYSINTGNFRLDGGAMFGVVPKVIWNKLNPADENNLCNWAMRSLLIEVEEDEIVGGWFGLDGKPKGLLQVLWERGWIDPENAGNQVF
jgi:hypothetical protein